MTFLMEEIKMKGFGAVILNLFQDPPVNKIKNSLWTLKRVQGDNATKCFTFKTVRAAVSGSSKIGFTLIELLVVVLIIGILASVALPQYQTAVAKSRIAGLIALGRSLQEAQKLHYMENGVFTNDFNLLDVTCTPLPEDSSSCKLSSSQFAQINSGYLTLSDSRVPNVLLLFYTWGGDDGFFATCNVYQGAGEELGNKICKSICGSNQFTQNANNKSCRLWD